MRMACALALVGPERVGSRPRRFEGSYYSSVFIHYKPTDWQARGVSIDDVQYAVPESWMRADEAGPAETLAALGAASTDALPRLALASTALLEPECEDSWCAPDSPRLARLPSRCFRAARALAVRPACRRARMRADGAAVDAHRCVPQVCTRDLDQARAAQRASRRRQPGARAP